MLFKTFLTAKIFIFTVCLIASTNSFSKVFVSGEEPFAPTYQIFGENFREPNSIEGEAPSKAPTKKVEKKKAEAQYRGHLYQGATRYSFEILFQQDGPNRVKGKSLITTENGDAVGEFTLTGNLLSDRVELEEQMKTREEGSMMWYRKKLSLKPMGDKLIGTWIEADQSADTGKVELRIK